VESGQRWLQPEHKQYLVHQFHHGKPHHHIDHRRPHEHHASMRDHDDRGANDDRSADHGHHVHHVNHEHHAAAMPVPVSSLLRRGRWRLHLHVLHIVRFRQRPAALFAVDHTRPGHHHHGRVLRVAAHQYDRAGLLSLLRHVPMGGRLPICGMGSGVHSNEPLWTALHLRVPAICAVPWELHGGDDVR